MGQVYIALESDKVPSQALSFLFAQSREAIKRRAVTQAIMLLRRALTPVGVADDPGRPDIRRSLPWAGRRFVRPGLLPPAVGVGEGLHAGHADGWRFDLPAEHGRQIVHRWRLTGLRGAIYAQLLPNGNLLVMGTDVSTPAPRADRSDRARAVRAARAAHRRQREPFAGARLARRRASPPSRRLSRGVAAERARALADGLFLGLRRGVGREGRPPLRRRKPRPRACRRAADELLGIDRLAREQDLRDPVEVALMPVRMSFAAWCASSTTRRISSSISRAISSE